MGGGPWEVRRWTDIQVKVERWCARIQAGVRGLETQKGEAWAVGIEAGGDRQDVKVRGEVMGSRTCGSFGSVRDGR